MCFPNPPALKRCVMAVNATAQAASSIIVYLLSPDQRSMVILPEGLEVCAGCSKL